MVLTPKMLKAFGQAVYGDGWQSILADKLGRSQKTISRWAAGQFNTPAGLKEELGGLIDEQIDLLARFRTELGSHMSPTPDSGAEKFSHRPLRTNF